MLRLADDPLLVTYRRGGVLVLYRSLFTIQRLIRAFGYVGVVELKGDAGTLRLGVDTSEEYMPVVTVTFRGETTFASEDGFHVGFAVVPPRTAFTTT